MSDGVERGGRAAWLVLPLVAFLAVFYLLPVLAMLSRARGSGDFAPVLDALTSPVALHVYGTTFQIAAVATIATLLLAYPLALVIAAARPAVASLLLALVMIPFWTSVLVRSYAWMVLLGRDGMINATLLRLGITAEPVRLLNTRFAVYIGMVHILLPFMVLPIAGALSSIDGRLLSAAANLGAGAWTRFARVVLPLSLPGVAAGVLLVFILGIGFYVTPALIGGTRDVTIAMLIAQEVELFHWDLAAAMSALLLLATLLVLFAFSRVVRIERVLGAKA